YRIHQARGERNVAVPELLQLQLHGLAVDSHVRDASAGCDHGLADVEGSRKSHGLDGHVDAGPLRQFHHFMNGVSIGAVDQSGCSELLGDCEALFVQVDHEDRGRRIKLRRQQNRESDRPRAYDGDRVPGLYLSVQDTALKTSRQNIAKHHHGFFITAGREVVETAIGVRDAHVLGLSSVEGVAQDPAAVSTVGIHALSAEIALQACGHARDDDLVSNVKLRDAHADVLDYTDALVAENAAIGHGWEISLQNVKIGSANRRGGKPNDGIARILDDRARLVLPGTLARTVIDQGLHGHAGALSCGTRSRQFELSSCHWVPLRFLSKVTIQRFTFRDWSTLHSCGE